MALLMEANLVDGEEAATINSDYVQASCLVTSATDSMSFEAGKTRASLPSLLAPIRSSFPA